MGINLCRAPNSLKFLASRNLTIILLLIQTIFSKDKSHTHTHTPQACACIHVGERKGAGEKEMLFKKGRAKCFMRISIKLAPKVIIF